MERWLFRLDILKTSFLLKLIYRFSVISVKISAGFQNRNWQADSEIHMEIQRTAEWSKELRKKDKMIDSSCLETEGLFNIVISSWIGQRLLFNLWKQKPDISDQ